MDTSGCAIFFLTALGFQEIRIGPPRKAPLFLYDGYHEDVARIEECHVHQISKFFGAFSIVIYELPRVAFTK